MLVKQNIDAAQGQDGSKQEEGAPGAGLAPCRRSRRRSPPAAAAPARTRAYPRPPPRAAASSAPVVTRRGENRHTIIHGSAETRHRATERSRRQARTQSGRWKQGKSVPSRAARVSPPREAAPRGTWRTPSRTRKTPPRAPACARPAGSNRSNRLRMNLCLALLCFLRVHYLLCQQVVWVSSPPCPRIRPHPVRRLRVRPGLQQRLDARQVPP